MGYDSRDRTAYGDLIYDAPPYKNRNISKWWTSAHDKLIEDLIQKYQWHWYWEIVDEIVKTLPKEIAESITNVNKVMYFATTRAKELGLTEKIRESKPKVCPLCTEWFNEDSLPHPLTKRLGFDHLDFCAPCLSDTLLDSGNPYASKDNVLDYLRDMANVLNRVPTQDFGGGVDDLHGLDGQERLALLQVLKRKPELSRVKELFGSWLNALKEAGILEDGARRTSRGTQCLAKDGHVCLSLGEKTIDDVLYAHGIPHQKEGRYPNENLRADFVVDEVFIEYLGLAGDSDYDAKTKCKQDLCNKYNINLILLYPKDLVSSEKLLSKLSAVLSKQPIP
jgi:hypothetical protein